MSLACSCMLRDCSSIRASSLILSVFSNVSVSRECSTAADSDKCRDDSRCVSSSRHMTRPPGGLTLLGRPCPPVSICGSSTSFDCKPNKRSGFRNSTCQQKSACADCTCFTYHEGDSGEAHSALAGLAANMSPVFLPSRRCQVRRWARPPCCSAVA